MLQHAAFQSHTQARPPGLPPAHAIDMQSSGLLILSAACVYVFLQAAEAEAAGRERQQVCEAAPFKHMKVGPCYGTGRPMLRHSF